MPNPKFKLGKKPPKSDWRNLHLKMYLDAKRLPAPPAFINHYDTVPSWPMYDNDVLGDCGPAGVGHQIQSWSYTALHGVTPTVQDIRDMYFRITGGVDDGVYLLDMMNDWRKNGCANQRIEAFVETDYDSLDQAKLSIQLFGSLCTGLSLPDDYHLPWTDLRGPPNPWNGHYVPLVGYSDVNQYFWAVTWGGIYPMSYDFFLKYADETYAALDDLSLLASGLSPEGFDFQGLQLDLDHLGDPIDPDPIPEPIPPEPIPPPEPNPDPVPPEPEPTPPPPEPEDPWWCVIGHLRKFIRTHGAHSSTKDWENR